MMKPTRIRLLRIIISTTFSPFPFRHREWEAFFLRFDTFNSNRGKEVGRPRLWWLGCLFLSIMTDGSLVPNRSTPNCPIKSQPFFAEYLEIVRVLSIVGNSFQIQGYFDSVLGARLADTNLNSNQIANFKDNLSSDNGSEESALTRNIPREL
jgi:hypothetical protein